MTVSPPARLGGEKVAVSSMMKTKELKPSL